MLFLQRADTFPRSFAELIPKLVAWEKLVNISYQHPGLLSAYTPAGQHKGCEGVDLMLM